MTGRRQRRAERRPNWIKGARTVVVDGGTVGLSGGQTGIFGDPRLPRLEDGELTAHVATACERDPRGY